MSASRSRGFTLIEVMIALGIVAIAMGVAYEWIFQTAATTTRNRDRTFAEWVALNQIAELRLAGEQPPVGRSNGEAELAGQTWRWELEVSETPVEDLRRLDIRVGFADEDPDRVIIALSGFAGPARQPSPPVDWYRSAGTQVADDDEGGGRAVDEGGGEKDDPDDEG